MKIVIAPDSYKESLSAAEAAAAIQRGFARVFPDAEYVCVPMADGGEGTAATLVAALAGEWAQVEVAAPLDGSVTAHYGLLPNGTAVMEMAEAAGLHLLAPDQRDVMRASTYGVGQMIFDALARGVRHIILGIGGSATNDGGAGMAQALGFGLQDDNNQPLARGGAALAQLAKVKWTHVLPALAECRFEVACDVSNPLCGEQGASAVFAPQKGANSAQVAQLDKALNHYADVLVAHGCEDYRNLPGSGAAGGLGFGLRTLFNAELKTGIDMVMAATGFADKICGADLVLTGEGRMDGQTAFGKVPAGVLRAAQAQQVPVIGLAGCLGDGAETLNDLGFTAIFSTLAAPAPQAEILANGAQALERTAAQVAAVWALGRAQGAI